MRRGLDDEALYELEQSLAVPECRDSLALLTAAGGGGLTTADLAELTKRSLGFHGRLCLRRRFTRSLTTRQQNGETIWLYSHDTLLEEAHAQFADDLAAWRERISAWADCYREQNWPVSTPPYLLGL